MKLHTPVRTVPMSKRHDLAIVRVCDAFQRFGQRLLEYQGVIANRLKRRWHAFKEASSLMLHCTCAAVIGLGRVAQSRSLGHSQSLMPQADAEHRKRGLRKHRPADAKVSRTLRRARAWREHDRVEVLEPERLFRVVRHDDWQDASKLGEILVEIKREGAVVINEQHSGARSARIDRS